VAQIILAEDDDALRTFLKRGLEKAGHLVISASNGTEALEALHAATFDLLIADIVMPGVDGVELARRATREQPELRIIATADPGRTAERIPVAGVAALVKPFSLADLAGIVRRTLDAAP